MRLTVFLNGGVISLRSAKIFHCFMYNTSRGPDFRTCFQQLGGLRALTEVPIIALTATAPQEIKSSICASLGLSEPAVISQTLDRPNIFLSLSKSKGLNVSMDAYSHIHVHVIDDHSVSPQ